MTYKIITKVQDKSVFCPFSGFGTKYVDFRRLGRPTLIFIQGGRSIAS
ncbi:unnamed protein product [Linum tenue]|uniref:Uncharacterized protein n=1 Tax=Linum tenue TaxID=586396 RepID=A0AAV0JVZ8_9ROSI|nr:unnamed protein product [Linum tenue]